MCLALIEFLESNGKTYTHQALNAQCRRGIVKKNHTFICLFAVMVVIILRWDLFHCHFQAQRRVRLRCANNPRSSSVLKL